jgi:flagellar hook-length control protein FliK
MQISLTATLPNASGEVAAKSMDSVHPESTSSFMAQMGQAMEEDQEPQSADSSATPEVTGTNGDSPRAASGPAVQSCRQASADRMNSQSACCSKILLEDASLAADALMAVGNEVLEEELHPLTTSAKEDGCSKEGEKESEPPDSAQSASVPLPLFWINFSADIPAQTPDASCQIIDGNKEAESIIPIVTSTLTKEAESIKATVSNSYKNISVNEGAIEFSSANSLIDTQEIEPAVQSEAFDATPESLKASANTDSLKDSVASTDAEKAGALKETAILESVRQRLAQIKVEAAPKDSFAAELQQTQSSVATGSKSDSKVMANSPDVAEQIPSLQDTGISEKIAAPSTPAKKSDPVVSVESVTANLAESRTDQNQTNSESFSRSSMQSKSDAGQATTLGKSQTASVQNKSELQAVAISNPLQSTETSAAASTSAELVSKPQSRDFVQQLADQIQVQVREGKEEIRIQLKPELLGRIEIKAEITPAGVTARIITESTSVKSYLENNIQILQQTLVDQGLRMDRIQIVAQDGMDAQFSSGYGTQFGQAGTGRNGRDSESDSETTGSGSIDASDEITVDSVAWLALNPNNRFYTVA